MKVINAIIGAGAALVRNYKTYSVAIGLAGLAVYQFTNEQYSECAASAVAMATMLGLHVQCPPAK
jgi:hypothetical protein